MIKEFIISDIETETPDCKTYYLQAINGEKLEYLPGQFLTILFDINGKEIRRSYSLGSCPGIDVVPFITVKRKENGEISRRIHERLKPGTVIKTLGAAGRFIVENPPVETYYFIAGGSGIVPIFSIIKYLLYFHPHVNVMLLNQSRTENDIIYKRELGELGKQFPSRFVWQQLLSKPLVNTQPLQRLNNLLLEDLLEDFQKSHAIKNKIVFFLCGPQALMRMAEFTLRLTGFKKEQIRKEQFVIETGLPVTPVLDAAKRTVLLHYLGYDYKFQVNYPQTVLEAALENGIQLPYSCKAGICSTCMATVKTGKVVMNNNEVLTDKELSDGKILTCVSYAATDVEISMGG